MIAIRWIKSVCEKNRIESIFENEITENIMIKSFSKRKHTFCKLQT